MPPFLVFRAAIVGLRLPQAQTPAAIHNSALTTINVRIVMEAASSKLSRSGLICRSLAAATAYSA